MALGDRAAKSKDWQKALEHYQAAMAASPSARALLNVASAQYELDHLGEAYEAYDEATRSYAGGIGPTDRRILTARMKEMAQKTGWLSVRVNEGGADVQIDGASIGISPVRALVRVGTGTHKVHVTKDGFAPFDANAEVAPDGKSVVEATLVRAANKGHMVVTSGVEGLRVIVDGVDVGAAPWEGDVATGTHEVSGRSSSSVAPSQQIDVAAGARAAVDLAASSTSAHLQVRTSDSKGIVYIDGIVKGEGGFSGDLAPGPHSIVVSREGFDRFEKTVTLVERQTDVETVTLKSSAGAAAASNAEAERPFEGIYGGFGLLGAYGAGGQGSSLETSCDSLSASSCQTPAPIGAGAFGYVGWTWNPVGFELLVGGMADETTQKARFDGQGRSGNGPLARPARDESFLFGRFGGLAALRVRASAQTRRLRGTIAGGVGFSLKETLMKRTVNATDGSGATSTQVSDPIAYVSPAITAEAALQIRLGATTALSIGALMWADSASIWGKNTVPPDPTKTLYGNGQAPVPLPTPQYTIASGPQVFVGPFAGMQFGP